MNISLLHDPFCRDVLSDVSTFLELVEYLTSRDEELKSVVELLDKNSFLGISYDLIFLAKVKKEFLPNKNESDRLSVGFLIEHKSCRDDKAIEQILRYQHHLMEENRTIGVKKDLPLVAIILYNGAESWNPLEEMYSIYPKIMHDYLLPFKCVFLDVSTVPDDKCLNDFSPRLGSFIGALKYARDPENHSDFLAQLIKRVKTSLTGSEALDLLTSMDIYLRYWISENFKDVFSRYFEKPPYKTIHDAEVEEAVDKQAVQTALKMLSENEPMDKIVRYSGLSEERIRSLLQSK